MFLDLNILGEASVGFVGKDLESSVDFLVPGKLLGRRTFFGSTENEVALRAGSGGGCCDIRVFLFSILTAICLTLLEGMQLCDPLP